MSTASAHGSTQPAPSEVCRQLRDAALFNETTMACFPWLAEDVSRALCKTNVARYHDHSALGFEPGAEIYGIRFYSLTEFLALDVAARREYLERFATSLARWRAAGSCAVQPPAYSSEAEPPVVWSEVYRKLPLSLYGPWRECWRTFRAVPAGELMQRHDAWSAEPMT